MKITSNTTKSEATQIPAGDWIQKLAKYRQPDHLRSVLEIVITGVPFILLWLLAWQALSISYLLALAICVPAAAFLVRLFLIQHDCGHGSFFRSKSVNDWVGRILGVITMTPYHYWRRSHAIHHASHGNLDKRGIGDIDTLTVREYQNASRWGRFKYRLYRHPIVLFGIGPAYVFLIQQRWPSGLERAGWRFWASALGTDLAIIVAWGVMIYLVGWKQFLMLQIPMTVIASSIGVWMFYVQHQFEDMVWDKSENWDLHEAAFYGSSHYDLPLVLRWLTASIGVHHVHHLSSRIPYYRLQDVLKDHPRLKEVKRLTLRKSFSCVKLQLWHEETRRLISFAEARTLKLV
jgi:acyl-lipid omega-6 desaturase (Delta-12 desaturase)